MLEASNIDTTDPVFKRNKITYFSRLGFTTRPALRMHQERGLWIRANDRRDWGNVTQHCLAEVARATVLGRLLNLPADIVNDLQMAAAMHDFGKKDEKIIAQTADSQWNGFEQAANFTKQLMIDSKVTPEIIKLVESVGHLSLPEAQEILNRQTISDRDIAFLLMHYIDDYTVNSEWSLPAKVTSQGQCVNSLDDRIDKNESTFRYSILNEEGRKHFNGETTFHAQRRIGNMVEQTISDLLRLRSGVNVEPKDIPIFVDNIIKNQIMDLTLK